MEEQLLPLAFLTDGRKAIVKRIVGGYGLQRKLNEMGFVRGTVVRSLNNRGSGPLIVCVWESRVAMGRGMAQKILVKEI